MARTWLPWRKLWPNRTVRRNVQGVDLYLPWSHVLPDYARSRSSYGQNLVELALGLVRNSPDLGPLKFVDVGANVGDSALQILNRADGRALCVEGDPYWARYLRMNVGDDPRVTVEESLLSPDDWDGGGVTTVRALGTSRLVPGALSDEGFPAISVRALREQNPDFANVRLIKSDTDGYDPMLVPALARAWAESAPVIFFEFDPVLAREVGDRDPNRVWEELAEIGYTSLAIWDNGSDPLGRLGVADARQAAASLEPRPVSMGYFFWDVAACRATDSAALATFDELMTASFDPRGVRSE